MFGNFIYFIIALLIYTTYHPPEKTNFTLIETLFLFLGLIAVFVFLSRSQFQRLSKQISSESYTRLDHKFNSLLARQSVMAIALFAVDIYGLSLSSFMMNIPLFDAFPTLQAVCFIALFILYLSLIWANAHETYQKLYLNQLARRSYIMSNISFSIPVLLPWLLLSGVADLINLLPFELPKRFFATTEGEVIYFLFFLFSVALLGPAMIQKFWGCTPLENGINRKRIENLCQKTGMTYNNILYWPIFGGRLITAGVMGLVKRFRYILVTNALLNLLQPEEIDAVIAHEIGHVKKKHLLFYLFFFVGYMLISYATFDLIVFFIMYTEPVYRFVSNYGFSQTAITSTLFSLVIILNFVIYFRYIFGYFMRNFERQADTYIYAVSENASALISTFEKIALISGQPPEKTNWHHFSIKERIAYLKKCEQDSKWIARHDRKVNKSIAAYLVGVMLMGAIGYSLNFGSVGRTLNNRFFEKIIQRELVKNPRDSNLYRMLGDLHYSRKNYESTIGAYEHSLLLQPHNPEVLNNLAWLYATCDDKKFRNPKRALAFAQQAAALKPDPHILDTLAESYYINRKFEKAKAVSRQALKLAGKNHAYYEKQLKKFVDAAQKENGRRL